MRAGRPRSEESKLSSSGSLVAVIGQGYVGLPLSLAAVRRGYDVVGLDVDPEKLHQISSGDHQVAGVSAGEISEAIKTKRFRVSNDYSDARGFSYAVITVPTPLTSGNPNLSFVEEASVAIGQQLTSGATVILESTTYPGTTEELVVPILESNSGLKAGKDFHVGYSPERIDPGNEHWTLTNTPKIISGLDESSCAVVRGFYESLGIHCVAASGMREAELSKLLENTFRHVNIALVNEMSCFADALDVDLWEAIDLAGTKPFGFMKFFPGPGVGGHCLPVDPSYLSWAVRKKVGKEFEFINLANKVNDSMPETVVQRLIDALGIVRDDLRGMEVLLIGLAYKKNVGDIRESPALDVAEILSDAGAAVYGIDSHISQHDWPQRIARVHKENLGKYRVGIIITPHDELMVESVMDSCGYVLDTHNVLPRTAGPS